MQVIRYRGRTAALAESRVHFAAWLDALEPEHPERNFVGAMCLYAHALRELGAGSAYTDHGAERTARERLMPRHWIEPHLTEPDVVLAEGFRVPLDQVAQRRTELS